MAITSSRKPVRRYVFPYHDLGAIRSTRISPGYPLIFFGTRTKLGQLARFVQTDGLQGARRKHDQESVKRLILLLLDGVGNRMSARLRGEDLNLRPLGYEGNSGCSMHTGEPSFIPLGRMS